MEKIYGIQYTFDIEDSELHLLIYDGETCVYSEDIIGEFENEADIRLTCLEIAKSKGLWGAEFEEDIRIKKAKLARQKSAERTNRNYSTEKRRKAANKAWETKKNKK